MSPRWLSFVVASLFGLFFAYDLWEAVGNLVGLSATAANLGTTLSAFGWTVLVVGLLLPAAIFAAAVWLGRRRNVGVQALLLLAGLCLSAVASLNIYALFGLGNLIV
ncbi:MAG TPA: hypothetical protein VEX88_04915 [Glaciibacter sp.]|nr:hypothetical protein [Glaciibacter sp.]